MRQKLQLDETLNRGRVYACTTRSGTMGRKGETLNMYSSGCELFLMKKSCTAKLNMNRAFFNN